MTIQEIQKVLSTSFKNGVYIRRPNYVGVELYINKNGEVWHVETEQHYTFKDSLQPGERMATDWEIV